MIDLPPERAKKLPKYPLIPATLLGRVAVSREQQGQKLGRILLMDALFRSLKGSLEVASVGVIAEARNAAARNFYLHHEFAQLPEHPGKMFIAMQVQRAFGR